LVFNKLFAVFENVGDGGTKNLDLTEFTAGLGRLGVRMEDKVASAEFSKLETAGGGTVSFDTFCTWFLQGGSRRAGESPRKKSSSNKGSHPWNTGNPNGAVPKRNNAKNDFSQFADSTTPRSKHSKDKPSPRPEIDKATPRVTKSRFIGLDSEQLAVTKFGTIEEGKEIISIYRQRLFKLKEQLKKFKLENTSLRLALKKTKENYKKVPPSEMLTTIKINEEGKDEEIKDLLKRLKIAQKTNDTLRKQVNQSFAPNRFVELENQISEKDMMLRTLKAENVSLTMEIKRMEKGFLKLDKENETFPDHLSSLVDELRVYKEKVRLYTMRHDEDQRTMRQQQVRTVDLEQKCRKFRSALEQDGKINSAADDHNEMSMLKNKVNSLEAILKERDAELRIRNSPNFKATVSPRPPGNFNKTGTSMTGGTPRLLPQPPKKR